MHVKRYGRYGAVLLVVVTLLLLDLAHYTSAQSPPKQKPPSTDFERLTAIFSPPGTPSIKDKPWKIIQYGPTNGDLERKGWIVEETESKIVLLDVDVQLHTFRKPRSDENRPTVPENEEGYVTWEDINKADKSIAWKAAQGSYLSVVDLFLKKGTSHLENTIFEPAWVIKRFGLADHIVLSVRHYFYLSILGHKDLSDKLYANAVKSYQQFKKMYGPSLGKEDELVDFVLDRVASIMRHRVVGAAHNGKPRPELLEGWKEIAKIPSKKFQEEARSMVKYYQNLIDEDARWIEPKVTDILTELSKDRQVEYWLYHLRDHANGQWMDPGSCDVLMDQDIGAKIKPRKPRSHPARELQNLGDSALPKLIAHLDDPRPTRCKSHWRRYWPEDHHLLSYGECCQQIFAAITADDKYQRASTPHPLPKVLDKDLKQKAEAWWADYQAIVNRK